MKQIYQWLLYVIGFLFVCTSPDTQMLYAQSDSSTAKPSRVVVFHLANGINLLQSAQLRESYGTQALYYWGVGLRAGDPKNDWFVVGVDYNFSTYRLIKEVNQHSADSLLRLNQLIPSLAFKLLEGKQLKLRARTGFIYAMLQDNKHRLENHQSNGFTIGLSLERKLFQNQAVHFSFDYDLMQPRGKTLRNYDVLKLGVGVYL